MTELSGTQDGRGTESVLCVGRAALLETGRGVGGVLD